MRKLFSIILFTIPFSINAQSENIDFQTYNKLYNDGTVLIGEKKFQDAIILFENALKIKPTSAEAIFAKGTCNLMLNKRDKACIDFENANKLNYKPALEYINKYCINKQPINSKSPTKKN
jgi:tetratricopeptide (TPR) repeat protein